VYVETNRLHYVRIVRGRDISPVLYYVHHAYFTSRPSISFLCNIIFANLCAYRLCAWWFLDTSIAMCASGDICETRRRSKSWYLRKACRKFFLPKESFRQIRAVIEVIEDRVFTFDLFSVYKLFFFYNTLWGIKLSTEWIELLSSITADYFFLQFKLQLWFTLSFYVFWNSQNCQ